jgi:hypothetical protein
MNRVGLVLDMPEAEYHSGPELSSTGARTLLDSPAKYDWQRRHPAERTTTDAMDFGTVVHSLVLGTGWPVTVVDADSWRTKAAQDQRRAARAEGGVAILTADHDRAKAAAAKVQEHPTAGRLFEGGAPEVSAFWTDERTGVPLRARFDYLPTATASGRPIAVDLKKTADASRRGFGKSVANYGYHIQSDIYRRAYAATHDGAEPVFLFVAVEPDEPFQVAVYELDPEAQAIGAELVDQALERFRDCTDAGVWPGLPEDIQTLSLPRWATYLED